MPEYMNIADLVDRTDPQGRTWRQINAAKTHAIPVGALVEMESGVRLFVVQHTRDCDMTPLYYLSRDQHDTVQLEPRFRNPSWTGGYDEGGLTVVRLPGS